MEGSNTRFITFLGTSEYDATRYRAVQPHGDGRTSPTVRFPVLATAWHHRSAGSLIALCTARAAALSFPKLVEQVRAPEHGLPVLHTALLEVPEGYTSDQLNHLFESVRSVLTAEAIRADAGVRDAAGQPFEEAAPPDRIVFDVTNGFRIQPLVAVAAVHAMRSEWRRAGAVKPPRVTLIYNMFDILAPDQFPEAEPPETFTKAAGNGVAAKTLPVRVGNAIDLDALLEAGAWTDAVTALLRFGRGDDLANLATSAEEGRDGETATWLGDLSSRVRALADAICTAQLPRLVMHETPAMIALLDRAPRSIATVHPLLPKLVADLAARLRRIECPPDSFMGPRGWEASLEVVKWYLELERLSEALAASQELGDLWKLLHAEHGPLPPPGQAGFEGAWMGARSAAEKLARSRSGAPPGSTRAVRNAVAHAGFRAELADVKEIREAVRRSVEGLAVLEAPPERSPVRAEARARVVKGIDVPAGVALPTRWHDAVVETAKASKHAKAGSVTAAAAKDARAWAEAGVGAVFFGPSASLAHLALVVELQERGIETWAWRPKGKALPDTVTTGRGSEGGAWTALPTVKRMVRG